MIKKENVRGALLLVLLLIGLSACGQNTMVRHVNNSDYLLPNEKSEAEVQLLHTEMWAYTGLRETKAIKSGHFSVYKAKFPIDLFKEIFPGRTVYYAWTVNEKTGKEFFTQLLFSGFEENGDPFVNVIIDGDESTGMIPEECFELALSTKLTRSYDIGGTMHPIDADNFFDLPEYRLEMVRKNGDRVTDLKKIANGKALVEDILKNWSYFTRNSDGARFYSPLLERQMKKLAKLNPQYDFLNKYKYNAKLVISPNYVQMAISGVFDVLISANAPSWGADFNSVIERDDMGLAIEYILALSKKNKQRAVQLMFEKMMAEKGFVPPVRTKTVKKPVVAEKKEESAEVAMLDEGFLDKSKIWSDYKSSGKVNQVVAISQVKESLEKLGIGAPAASVLKRLVLEGGEYKYLSLESGTSVMRVVMNGKIILQDSIVKWKKGLNSLPMKWYGIKNVDNKNEVYAIGLTDYGHWVRFK